MRLVTIQQRPFTVIDGKDFAVYRRFEASRKGPVFLLQLAGGTALARVDLPTDGWIVTPGHAGNPRIATA